MIYALSRRPAAVAEAHLVMLNELERVKFVMKGRQVIRNDLK
jgi:hypothetical protein